MHITDVDQNDEEQNLNTDAGSRGRWAWQRSHGCQNSRTPPILRLQCPVQDDRSRRFS